jgi:putative DNA primase/helicase
MHLSQQSDRSRVTLLGLKAPSEDVRKERFQKLMAIHADLINDDFTSALKARTVKMMPVIRHNSAIFNKAAVSVLGTQRHGDQLGSLLAGAVSLEYDGEITYEQALEWVSSKDWNEELSLDSSKDEIRLFTHIMEYRVNVETEYNMKLDRSIGELCLVSAQVAPLGNPIAPEKAEQELARWGISVRMLNGKYIIAIANQHSGLKKILRGTSWSADNHSKVLERIPNTVGCEPFRFASSTSRAVGIPISLLN